MFKSNVKKIRKINKDIERSFEETRRRRVQVRKKYKNISKNINQDNESNFKRRIKKEMNSR